MKKVLIGVGVVLALAVAAVLIVPGFIDWNAYKGEILAAARDATGREVAIDGDVSLSLLPAPALSAEGIRVANIEGGSQPDMVRLAGFEMRLAFAPLLSGKIQVERIRLVEPEVLLEVVQDGRQNWLFTPADATGAPAAATAAGEGGGGIDLRLDAIELENASVIYRDARSGLEEGLTGLSATASAGSLQGPFRASGRTTVRAVPLHFDLAVGALEADQPLPLRLALTLEGTPGEAVVTMTVSNRDTEPTLKGDVKISADRVGALAAVLAPGMALPGLADQPLVMSARLAGTPTQLGINNLALSLGGMQASGAISLDLSQGTGIDAALEVGRLNLDELLAQAGAADSAAKPASGGAPGVSDDAVAIQLPTLPADLRGAISLGIDGVTYRGRIIRQVQLAVALDNGTAVLQQASALLPGGSDFRLSGAVVNEAQEPAFKGRLELASDNLRALLDWLAVDLSRVPAGRLSTLVLTADLDARPSLVQIAGLNLRLDNSTITGGIAARVQRRPSFGLSLRIDRLNLDGYLPRPPAQRPAATAPQGQEAAAAAGRSNEASLAVLDSFDTNFALEIGRLTYNGIELRDVGVDLSLYGGTLTVKRIAVADGTGAIVSASGAATGFASKPAIDLRTEFRAAHLGELAKALDLGDGFDWRRIEEVALAGVINGTADLLVVDLAGRAAGADLKLRGTARDPFGTPELDLSAETSHPDAANLLQALGLTESPGRAGGGLKLVATAKGTPALLSVALQGDLAGLSVQSQGSVASKDGQTAVDLKLDARHPDLAALIRSLGSDYRPALEADAGLSFAAAVSGTPELLRIADIAAAIGPARVAGEATLTLNRPTPHVAATLNASEIVIDRFLPRHEPGSGAASRQQGAGAIQSASRSNDRRWSRAPLDLTGMAAVDADVTLSADGLVFQQYPFVKPRLVLHLEAGALTIRELKGGLFGGNVGLSAVIESRPVTAFALNTKLVGADVEAALRTAAGLDTVTGRLDFESSVRARGNSQWDLVNDLNGTARMHAENGVIRGFDLRSFSDRMQKLTETAHFLDLVNRTFSGGQTAYSSVDGTWQIENGVARTADTRAALDAGEATLTGAVALPPWQLTLQSRMRLTEHDNAPNIGVDLRGPIDAPKPDVKTAELERWVLGRAARELLPKALGKKGGEVGKILDGVLGGGKSQGDGKSQDSGAQQQAPLDSLLRGLLRK